MTDAELRNALNMRIKSELDDWKHSMEGKPFDEILDKASLILGMVIVEKSFFMESRPLVNGLDAEKMEVLLSFDKDCRAIGEIYDGNLCLMLAYSLARKLDYSDDLAVFGKCWEIADEIKAIRATE